jgi:hypothetical protein
MVVIAPDGVESQYDMHDDGLHGDALANDGVFAATFVPAAAGAFVWFAHVHDTTPAGVPFQRTTEHLVRIASVDAELTGKAHLTTSAPPRFDRRRARQRRQRAVAVVGGGAAALRLRRAVDGGRSAHRLGGDGRDARQRRRRAVVGSRWPRGAERAARRRRRTKRRRR